MSKVTARLQKAHNAAFTVTVSAAAVLPAEAGDFTLSDNPVLTFEAGATDSTGSVTVTAEEDTEDTENKQVTVSGTVSVGATVVRPPEDVTLTITDDDLPAVTIAAGTGSVTEGANAVFELTRAGVITKALAVTVQVTQSGAFLKAPADYTEAVQAVFNAGSETTTLTAATQGDATDEANGSITATVTTDSDAAYRLGADSSAEVTVEDDDLPKVALVLSPPTIAEQDDTATNERDESVSVVTATVPLAAGTAFTVTVSATPAGGYTLSDNRVLTFEANATESTGAVTVTAENNDVDAADKQVTVSGAVSEPDAAVAHAPDDVTLTITDDDLPTVTLVLAPAAIAENGTVSRVTATVPRAADTAFTVTVSAAAVSPAKAGDFTLSADPVLTFEANATVSTGAVTVTAENDDVDAADKQVTVSGAVSNAAVANAPDDVTLTITDDDLPAVTIAAETGSVTEGDNAVFTLTRIGVITEVLTVAVDVTQSGAFLKTSEGYTKPTSAVFPAESDTAELTVATEGDNTDEANGSITATVTAAASDPAYRLGTKSSAEVTVEDDDLPVVTLVLSPPTIAERDDKATPTNEAQTVVTATVPLAADTAFTVTVSATPAGDYTLSADRVLTFEADATVSTGAVTITAEDNVDEDGDKAVTVSGAVSDPAVAIAPDAQTLTITDDEGLPKVALVLTPVTVKEADDTTTDGENEAQARVTARLQKAHNAAFTVTVAAAAVSPADADDFRLSDNPVLTFEAGATDSTGSVTVTAVDNDVDEQEKQVTVSGTVSVGATAVRAPEDVTLTITDDDLPKVTIAAGTGSVTEGANAVFELTRAGVITKALAVTVQVTQSGAFLKAPEDYTEAVQAEFNAGSETTTLTVETQGDGTDEANGSITATVTTDSDAAYRLGADSSAKVTVEDDDLPTVALVLSPPTIAEQDDTATNERDESVSVVTATVPLAAGTAFTVTVSATPAGGYTLSENRVLTFEANATESTGAVTVTAENNDVDAADKTVTVSGTVSNSAVANAPAAQTLTITDDDLPKVTIAAGTSPVTEGTNAVFELTRVGVITEALTVAVGVTQSGTFIKTSDGYTAPQQVVFPAESDTAGLTVATQGDDTDEADGSVTATVSTGEVYRVGTKSSAKVTVEDDDLPTVELVLSQQTIAEQDDTTTTDKNELVSVVTATVPLAADTEFTVTVSATPAGGYTLSENKVLTFEAGATGSIGLVTVTAVNNDVDAADKQVTVSGAVSNAAVANAPEDVTLTIKDDDLPVVTIAAGTSPVTEGANAVFELTRVGVITEALTVAVEVTQSGAFIKTSEDYTAPTSAVFNAESNTTTLTVETEADTVDEADGSITLTVIAEQDAPYTVHLTKGTATVDVTDDDLPVVTLVLSPPTIAERDDTTTDDKESVSVVTATVPLAADTEFTVTVSATPAGGYTLSANRVLTFEANATVSTGSVTITAEDNSTEDGDKIVTVSGEVPETGIAIAPDNQTLTITDDEGLPKVALVLTPGTVEEADDEATTGENESVSKVTATLQKAHNAAFTVTVSAAAVLPAEAGDFTLSDNPVLTFEAGATDSTGSVTVTAEEDTEDTENKQVTVSGTVSVGATVVRPPEDVTLTITDDDLPAVTIAAETGSVTEGANAVFELTRAGVITKALAVTVQVTQSGAFLKAPADYTEAVQAVFNAGSETTTLTAATQGDATDEANGSITATVTTDSDAAYRLGADSSAEVTVEDDDLPKVALVLSPPTIAEQDDTATNERDESVSVVTATVPLAAGTAFTVTVSATPAGGYTLSGNRVLTFEANATESTGAVTVTAENNDVDAADKQVTVSGAVSEPDAAVAHAPDDVTLTITDDDLPTVTLVLAPAAIAENGTVSRVTATVPRAADTAFTVTVSAAAVSPAKAGDFTLSADPVLTFEANATVSTGAVTVTAENDDVDAADKQVTVSGAVSNAAVANAPDDVTLTITDDDLPAVTIAAETGSVTEGDNAVFTLTRIGVITEVLTVAVDVTQSGAFLKTSEGYTKPTSAVFPAESDTAELTVATEGDNTDEANGSITATVTAAASDPAYRLGTKSSAEVTVEDDDLPVVTLVLSPPTIAERDDKATPTNEAQTVVTATVPLAADTAFTVTVSATPAGDYTLSADRVLTFEADATVSTGAVTITAEDNVDEDGDKAVTVSGAVSDPAVAIAPDAQTLTITDDEGLPKVALVLTPVTVKEADDTTTDGENEAQARVTARLQKAHNAAFTVTVAAAAVSPADADDFRLSDNPVLTFEAGATDSTGSVTVTAVDNDVDEQEKQVTVSGTVSVGATAVRAPEDVTLTITDDDLPKVTIAAGTGSVTEGANAVFELTRAGVITKALAVTVQVTQSGAFLKAPEDYTEAVQAEFNAGSETTTLTVETQGDGTDEANGSITATVTAASDAAYRLGTESSAKVTVEDDDLPTVELVLSQQTIAEQDDTTTGDKNESVSVVTATVPLAAGTPFTVTVSATPAGGYTLSENRVLTFEANATVSTGAVTVTAKNNDVDAADKQVTVSGAVSESDAAVANAPEDVTLTITDDDLPVVTLVLSQQTIAEQDDTATTDKNESVSVVTATVPLAADTEFTVTVSATPAGGYTLSENKVLTFEAGATGSTGAVTVTAVNDDVDTADKTVTVSGTVSNAAVANAPEDVTLTITDDDLPKVTIAAGTSPVTEGANAVFELTRVGVITEALTVAVGVTQSGTFIKTSDGYTAPQRVVFPAESDTAGLTVATEGDDTDEADGSVTATVSTGEGYRVGTESSAEVTVEDDDLPTVELVLSPSTIAERDDTGTEKNEAVSVVTATVPLAADTAFTVTVSATPAGGYTLSADRVLTFEANATVSTGAVTITAENNSDRRRRQDRDGIRGGVVGPRGGDRAGQPNADHHRRRGAAQGGAGADPCDGGGGGRRGDQRRERGAGEGDGEAAEGPQRGVHGDGVGGGGIAGGGGRLQVERQPGADVRGRRHRQHRVGDRHRGGQHGTSTEKQAGDGVGDGIGGEPRRCGRRTPGPSPSPTTTCRR